MTGKYDYDIDAIVGDLFNTEFMDVEDLAEKLNFFWFYRSYSEEFTTANNMSFFEGAFVSYVTNKLVQDWESATKKKADHNLISMISKQLADRQEEIYELYRQKIKS